jgi:p-cumate 2,3-dioxygenase beta subunit
MMPAEIEEGGTKQMQANQMPVTRQTIEDFLFAEAALLDAWQLEKWLELFREDALYLIPPTDEPQLDRHAGLYLVMDDMRRLRSRVAQILGRSMWAENPVSRTRRLIGNVRILAQDAGELSVAANFSVYRMRHEAIDIYVGSYAHRLAITAEGLRFIERKATLDLETLNPQGKISIIL